MGSDDLSNRVKDAATPRGGAITDDTADCPHRALQRVLEHLIAGADVRGSVDWELVGAHAVTLAERDARDWQRHAEEYAHAYTEAVITLFRMRPRFVAAAPSPWGLAVAKGRLAGRHAAGLEALCGLTNRDPVTHHARPTRAPRVVSLELIAERGT